MQTLVFYDGSCSMCVGVSGWLSKIDGKKQFKLLPFQREDILKNYPEIKPEDCRHEIHIVTAGKKVMRGADAVLYIWKVSGHPSSFAASLFSIPPFIWLARIVYKLIARNRNRFFR